MNISKETREIQRKEKTTRKELENFRARGKPSERDWERHLRASEEGANRLKETRDFRKRKTRSKPLERTNFETDYSLQTRSRPPKELRGGLLDKE